MHVCSGQGYQDKNDRDLQKTLTFFDIR